MPVALTLLLVLSLLTWAVAGCGGDDDSEDGPRDSNTTTGSVQTATTAAEMVPDVASLGFEPVDDAAPALETDNSKIVLFENPSGDVPSLRLEIVLAPNVETATSQFGALADALRNPPPGLFGADAKQTEGTTVYQADQSRSYQTDKPDDQGTIVFSDIHRFGRAIAIMYTIGGPGAESESVRKQVAEMMAAKAPR